MSLSLDGTTGISATGNIISSGGVISATGNIYGGNIIGTLVVSTATFSGNVTAGNQDHATAEGGPLNAGNCRLGHFRKRAKHAGEGLGIVELDHPRSRGGIDRRSDVARS